MAGERILDQYGDVRKHDLNELLWGNEDNDENIEIFPCSHYVDRDNLTEYMKNNKNRFTILSLNCQSINAKFNEISLLVNSLTEANLPLSAICLQESWLKDQNTTLYDIPNYNIISQKATCSKHGGLIIYLHKRFSFKMIDLKLNS